MLVIDADGLIKLNRAGVLAHVGRAFSCLVPTEVYEEAVVRAKARLYPDADTIETVVVQAMTIVSPTVPVAPEAGLGVGDLQVLGVALAHLDAVVVSDDRRLLTSAGRLGLRFTTAAQLIVVLARIGALTADQATDALQALRSLVRPAVYDQAVQDLDQKRKEAGES